MKRLTPAKVTMLMFMVIGGLIAAYIAKGLFANTTKLEPPRQRNVPMAMTDILPGTVITEEHLGNGPVADSELTRDTILLNRVLVGRIVKEKLLAARPIRAGQLYEVGGRPPLPLAQEMRAVSITIGSATGIVDGLIKPGEYVDMHFAPKGYDDDPRVGKGFIMTLLKGVKILAINRLIMPGAVENDKNTVTLELTPEQSNIVLLAKDKGTIDLSYNPQGKGDGTISLKGKDRATLEEILGLEPVKEPAKPFVSQVYRGNSRQELQFPGNNTVIERNGLLPPTVPQPAPQTNTLVPQNPGFAIPPNPNPPPVAPTAPVDPRTINPQSVSPNTAGPQGPTA